MGASGSKQPPGQRKKVLVLGGGYAGTEVAKLLDLHYDVTVIDRQNYMTHSISVLRGITNKEFAPLTVIPYNKLLKDGQVIQADIVEISPEAVTIRTASGETKPLPFDYLVMATGHSVSFPCRPRATDLSEALEEMEQCSLDIESAQKVLICGGGATGVELAGEIKDKFPQKKVILAHGGEYLLSPGLSAKFYSLCAEKLSKVGVEVCLKERISLPEFEGGKLYHSGREITVTSESGRSYTADLIFKCTGALATNPDHLKYFESNALCDAAGRIRVNEHMQVGGLC